jgi:uncharacterized membrane protein YheB (UPF0754 family)
LLGIQKNRLAIGEHFSRLLHFAFLLHFDIVVENGGHVMDRLSPQLLLSLEERAAISAAIQDLCGSRMPRSTGKKGRPTTPNMRHSAVIFSLSVVSLLATHAVWINTGY